MSQAELDGMPEPSVLRLLASDGQVLVTCGPTVVYRYEAVDIGMRNLAVVALTDAGRRVDKVAAVFGLTATYVSMLRGRARARGSAGLVRRRGRPPKLSQRQVAKARGWSGSGWTQTQIADRLGVSQSVISELLTRLGPTPAQERLPEPDDAEPSEPSEPSEADHVDPVESVGEDPGCGPGAQGQVREPTEEPAGGVMPRPVAAGSAWGSAGSARIASGTHRSRYAGAMLLHPYLCRIGAQSIFSALTGAPARRYDDLAVLTTATLGFALGSDTVEGAKHLRRSEAGPVAGLGVTPELTTLRARLSALADGSDPLQLQRRFAAAMIAADPADDPVYFVDDHFKAYAGARPVAKGWNTRRRHAQPGIDDTHLVDARGRAVVFGTGEPSGLASTLPGVLAELRAVVGPDAPIMLGFDRGGAFPVAFTACRDAGADWVTYRRAPLVEATVEARRSRTAREGTRISVVLADETVELEGYGSARQLTLFEAGAPVLQVLTSDTTATGADLLCWLRARWRIENMFKYAVEHNGIDTLADYAMDIGPDPRKVPNPARVAARKAVRAAEADLIAAERALPQMLTSEKNPAQMNAALPRLHKQIEEAKTALDHAKATLRPIPAKVPATDLDPDAKRARPRIEHRGLQMVLRLLAFNAEAWLADHLNAYLADPDEYREITRNLLHLGGQTHYTTKTITVTLDRPDSPRIARALQLLAEELNATDKTRLPGDRRPITYHLTKPRISTLNAPLLAEV
ncbi:MAG: helix-turn-helix domain-containing protein [Nocardioidaceae bacterium]